ncbi:ester cyclase [Aquimarina sp. D1M17]|uniref:ester cyclase n=1 Tax=Aquimarina acroporae TaxID=2937283 RepID=UPI0020C05A34|nr:ester cyclase [Aquimarina acroporae]MCK8520010.1 ester cyclase [Aquimarina acroporae]
MNSLTEKAKNIIDVWNQKDITKLNELYGEETTFYDPLLDGTIKGKTLLGYAKGIYAAFPDLEFVIQGITVSDNLAMVEWVQKGTNTGEIMGKPATGRYVEIPAVSVIRFDGSSFVSQRDYWDMKKLYSDLFKN